METKKTVSPKEDISDTQFYRLKLFVAGDEPNSVKAKSVISRLCEEHLKDRYEIQIIDVFVDYQAAIKHGVVVVPTLIVESPPPTRTIVGSLNDENMVLAILYVSKKEGHQ